MSKQQLFRDFVNKRLVAAALEIFERYEKTLAECQDELSRCRETNEQLQRMFNIGFQPQIKLHRTDVQLLSLPEPPQIKEEQDLWTSQGEEELQRLQSETTDSMFTSPRVKTPCDPEDSSELPPLDQTPTVENREQDANTTEEIIKAELVEEDYGELEPACDFQSPTPDSSTAQSLEEEERGPLPELTTRSPRRRPTRALKLSIKSRRTQTKCSRVISSPGLCLSPWTRPISSSCSESEDASPRESEKSKDASPRESEKSKDASPRESEKSKDASPRESEKPESKTGEKPYQCEECDKAFCKKCDLVKHRRIHKKAHQCQDCDKAFSEKSTLVIHRRIHTGEKPYQCDHCDAAFKRSSHLIGHRRIHTGEKPYVCHDCGKAFNQRGTLVSHRRIHTGEKPYQCQECDKAFSEKAILVNHRRIHTGEKPYQCEECDKAFRQRCDLVKHRRTHNGERPYQCQDCDKAFNEKGTLTNHRRIHTGEKPYQCQDCDKAFSKKSTLVNHRRIHTGEKPYPCEKCGKAFRQRSDLGKHRRTHNREK